MSQQEYNDISANDNERVKVNPAAFKHELTQIYLELKDSFSTEYVAQQAPQPEIDEEILHPKTEVKSPDIEVQLPEIIDVFLCNVQGYSFNNDTETVIVQPQAIYNPEIHRFEVELSQKYDFEQSELTIPNTDWCECETDKIEFAGFSLISPSVTKFKQDFEFNDIVQKNNNFKFNFAKTDWEEKDVYVDKDSLVFNYECPAVSPVKTDSFSFKSINFQYKMTAVKITNVIGDFSMQSINCPVDIPMVNSDSLLVFCDKFNSLKVKTDAVDLPTFAFDFKKISGYESISDAIENLANEDSLNEIMDLMCHTLETLNYDLLKR